jgi:S1-C subfamily serine protease
MTEHDPLPVNAHHEEDTGQGASPPWPSDRGFGVPARPPRPPRRRAGAVIAALLLAGAASLAAIGLDHIMSRPASASPAPSRTGAAASVPASRSTTSSLSGVPLRPLTTSAMAARIDPGLVDINVTFGLAGARGAATGMVLTPSGEVLTTTHVIRGATSVSVTDVGNGRTYSATVVGYDPTSDVAVLQLRGATGLQTVPLGDSAKASVGSRVTALGNAGGVGGKPRIASGRIVALNQTITASDAGGANAERLTGLTETNARIRPGDSGGPLVDRYGRVIGMDAAASATLATSPASAQGYAIPIDEAIAITRQIEAGISSPTVHVGPTGFLGVQIIPTAQLGGAFGGGITTQTRGAVVGGVLPGYPAQRIGLAQGDVITSVDGQPVTSATRLTDLLSAHRPGDSVRLRWIDPSGQPHAASVTLASGPAA